MTLISPQYYILENTSNTPPYSNVVHASSFNDDFRNSDDNWVREKIEDLRNILSIENLEPEMSWTPYLNKIDAIRETGVYERFLELSLEYGPMVGRAILNSMMRYSYEELKPEEEKYVLGQMQSGDLSTQETALGVLQAWGDFSYVDELSSIVIKDKYLQNELTEYLDERKTT